MTPHDRWYPNNEEGAPSPSGVLAGVVASRGLAVGSALVISEKLIVPRVKIEVSQVRDELSRFDEALARGREQLTHLKNRNWESAQTVQIIESQQMILRDPLFVGEVIQRIREELRNVEGVVFDVVEEFALSFENLKNPYMRDRALDIRDVGSRILRVAMGRDYPNLSHLQEDTILVCRGLSPSEVVHLDRRKVRGIVSETGGITSHAAILASSLNICAVVGASGATTRIRNGDVLVVDGVKGIVRINPPEQEIREFNQFKSQHALTMERAEEACKIVPRTRDGVDLEIHANIAGPQELELVTSVRAHGVGLFRTEYLFINADHVPTEEEQFQSYKSVAMQLGDKVATYRTLDLGGDKEIPYLNIPRETNPSLGWRSIRFCLDNPEIFKPQLRAILRASHFGNVRIMFPMISRIAEIRRAKELLNTAKQELEEEGDAFNPDIKVGAMIETPAAAILSDIISREVDFLSIGTNDLIQFTMAMDRGCERFGDIFGNLGLPTLRLIRMVLNAASDKGVEVSSCGEITPKPHGFVLLMGLGIRKFSMNASSIPYVKQMIPLLSCSEAVRVAEAALACDSSVEVKRVVDSYLAGIAPRFEERGLVVSII